MRDDPTIAAGELDQLISIYQEIESADSSGYGEAIPTDRIFANVWVKAEPQSGREFFRASQVYPTLSHLLTIRYLDGLNTKMKVVVNGRNLNIVGITNVGERNITLRLACTEAV